MDKFLKILDFVLVIAAIVLAVYVGKNIGLEYLMRGREEPVTLSMTEGGLPEDYIGRPAGGDIPLIEDGHSWEEAWATDYITIQPVPTCLRPARRWQPGRSNGEETGERH